MKRAFTLIELLVVIAIIAILAAILFPVFAQAKLAAKKTQSLSNQKQNSLAAIMYMGDADDQFVLTFWPGNAIGCAPGATYPGPKDTDPMRACSGGQIPGWTRLIQPYSKNYDLLKDPTVGDPMGIFTPGGPYTWWVNWGRFSHYGYNWAYLCPSTTTPGAQRPFSQSSLGAPAETVLFVDSRFSSGGKWISGYIVSDPPTAALTGNDEYWFGGWTSVSPDPRYTGGFNVTWTDGHAKFDRLTRLNNDTLWDRE
jgi:prepilin-type N-terminal cleavage/methylation domain-containing protein/prepilin-type processing-associated H-X9-DG protein